MSDFITALSDVRTLLVALNGPQVEVFLTRFGYKPDLQALRNAVETLNNVLLNAGHKNCQVALAKPAQDYIQELKNALYDADDLFDKFVTQAELMEQLRDSDRFEKVRHLFSSKNPFIVARSMSRGVEKIRKKLNDIADVHAQFGFSFGTQHVRRKMVGTQSYFKADVTIGREDDVRDIVGRTLNSTDDVGFLTIVGMGGLGKTALAQLVFNEESIESEFPMRSWTCVADQDGARLDVKVILSNILESAGFESVNKSSIEYVQQEYERYLGGKKVFLVLDDIWTENPEEWQKLRQFLMKGGKGSRIIVTTRSITTARIIGNDIHELKGLSDEHSWRLFQMLAFGGRSIPPDFVNIGQKIVQRLSNIPLFIRVIGSLLYGQSIDRWHALLVELDGYTKVSDELNASVSILKVSYDHLEPSERSCFSYCALFPKDYVMKKEVLMNLWEAQGYIVPFDQSIEDACEEHFATLLQRHFFQDVKTDEYGDVESVKMHDLMHDLAQRASGKEICVLINSNPPETEYDVRHIFDCTLIKEVDFIIQSKIRSYLLFRKRWLFKTGNEEPLLPPSKIVKEQFCLRALALQGLRISSLPDTMGNLLHLRYLNLAKNSMKKLPESISKLHNLQTLNLNKCDELNEWPEGFSKLVNLKHLFRDKCYKLRCMPVGICNLTRLRVLTDFVVEDESEGGMQHVGQLKDLKALSGNLKTRLSIQFHVSFTTPERYSWEGGCLEGAEHLKEVEIGFSFPSHILRQRRLDEVRGVKEEVVMTKLQPHPNLKKFMLSHYAGNKITSWGRAQNNWAEATYLPNLIHIKFSSCLRLKQLPLLSKLLHLKSLYLYELKDLKYVEEEATNTSGSESSGPRLLDTVFFPSLESLEILELKNLQGWWRACNSKLRQLAFSRLHQLNIENCPQLTSFPKVPSHTKVELREINKGLKIRRDEAETSSSFQPTHPILTCP